MHIYASCEVWKFDPCKGWGFAFDKEKGGRVLAVELTSSFEDLRTTAFENFGIDQNDVELELSYLPMELINTIDCPPVIIGNDRQVKNFLTYEKGGRVLAVELTSSFEDLRTTAFEDFGIDQNDVELELTYLPMELINTIDCPPVIIENDRQVKNFLTYEQSNASGRERGEPSSFSPRDGIGSSSESSKDGEDECNSNAPEEDEDADLNVKEEEKGKSVRFSLKDVVKRDADVTKWARCQFQGYRYGIRTTNSAESINSALRSPREKHTKPLTIVIEKKIDRRINKGKTFLVQPVNEHRFLVRGDTIDCLVDLDRRIYSCGKYDLLKIPCRHAIKAGLTVGRAPSSLTDFMYTTSNWRTAYEETINPIGVPQDSWVVPYTVRNASVLAHESRRGAGRRRKRRYETVEDKLRS
ncbi:hypothetical protein F2Q69_00049816 [Brassica cretica]|uniref:SWIM-type domain-containing protein n=1 Tax=Brassica cretica TaxID=69181 RepID=A0A8S9PNX5_BRACR|nr:hypothetical protein F2Q69_00049816 [Brassica cretica]